MTSAEVRKKFGWLEGEFRMIGLRFHDRVRHLRRQGKYRFERALQWAANRLSLLAQSIGPPVFDVICWDKRPGGHMYRTLVPAGTLFTTTVIEEDGRIIITETRARWYPPE